MAWRESDLGLLALARGRHEEALTRIRSALDRHRELEDPEGVGLDLQRLARVYAAKGEWASAEVYADRARQAHLAAGNLAGAVEDLLILARVHHEQGDLARARSRLDQARALLPHPEDDLLEGIRAAEQLIGPK